MVRIMTSFRISISIALLICNLFGFLRGGECRRRGATGELTLRLRLAVHSVLRKRLGGLGHPHPRLEGAAIARAAGSAGGFATATAAAGVAHGAAAAA